MKRGPYSQPPDTLAGPVKDRVRGAMKFRLALMLGLASAGCGQAPDQSAARNSAEAPPSTPVNQLETAPATAFKSEEENELLDFGYSYPAEAAAIPVLAERLQADLARIKAQALDDAKHDQSSAKEMDRPFHGHYLHKTWANEGESARFLSLTALIESFTGGAHGNSGFSALLWDRRAGKEARLADLFTNPDSFGQLTRARYCAALDAERLKRREGEALEGEFSECPKPAELIIAPSDEDEDGRFDHLRFLAGPYVAGPYAEGAYEISVPIPGELLTAVKAEFRDSFEAQPQ